VPRDFIVLFRGEYAHEVQWAGEPSKPMQAGPLGDRLTPRKSFALWTEERRGQARPWSGEETAIAEKLRVTLIEVILQLLDASHAEREAATRRQQDLIAELNHRVRNSLTMIGSMVNQGGGTPARFRISVRGSARASPRWPARMIRSMRQAGPLSRSAR
jgi:light-regulated signal transduction histidine kinase (bacteriophytochrome)